MKGFIWPQNILPKKFSQFNNCSIIPDVDFIPETRRAH